METEIKRINFFDGLFLREKEFQDEQTYHTHMRRRLNYILFDKSGVVDLSGSDLKIVPTAGKNLHVSPGMAISMRDDLLEGREIILRTDSPTVDLSTTFAAGDQVFVAICYAENPTDPQPVAGASKPTRTEQSAIVTFHKTVPPPGSAPGNENYILLGRVAFDTMAVDSTQRQTAKIRASLIGSAVPGPASLVSIAVSPVAPTLNVGAKPTFTATGTFSDSSTRALTAADGLQWSSSNVGLLTIDVNTGAATAIAAGVVTISAKVGAVTGTTSATVTTPVPAPSNLTVSPTNGIGGQVSPITLSGLNIHDTALPVGANPASATNTTNPISLAIEHSPDQPLLITSPIVASPLGGQQRIQFQLPPRPNATWTAVTIRLSHLGGSVTVPFTYLG